MVVWVPFSDKNRLGLPMFEEELEEYAKKNGIKLYLTSELEDEYSQNDIISYANSINADAVIGILMDNSGDFNPYMMGICNTSYFMPDYNSAKLSVNLVGSFANVMNFDVKEFEEAGDDCPLVYEARVPSALVELFVPNSAMETDEDKYNIYENIYYGIRNTIDSVISDWRLNDNENK
jgi:N-acetylmuramoyl-L-alanine amidase